MTAAIIETVLRALTPKSTELKNPVICSNPKETLWMNAT